MSRRGALCGQSGFTACCLEFAGSGNCVFSAIAKRQRSQGQGNKVPLWALGQSPNRSPNRSPIFKNPLQAPSSHHELHIPKKTAVAKRQRSLSTKVCKHPGYILTSFYFKKSSRIIYNSATQPVDKSMQTPRIHDIIRIMIPG